MKEFFVFLLFSYLQFGFSSKSDIDCGRIPPALWCDSKEIAEKCNVIEQCQKYDEGSKDKNPVLTYIYWRECRYCQHFTETQLKVVYEKMGEHVDIEFIPLFLYQNGTLYCGEGDNPKEGCEIAKIMLCSLKHISQPGYPFFSCFDKKIIKNPKEWKQAFSDCYEEVKVPIKKQQDIHDCIFSNESEQLINKSIDRLNNFWPGKVNGVPWVLFNNYSFVSRDADVFLQHQLPVFICQSLVGLYSLPKFCYEYGNSQY